MNKIRNLIERWTSKILYPYKCLGALLKKLYVSLAIKMNLFVFIYALNGLVELPSIRWYVEYLKVTGLMLGYYAS